MSPNNYSDEILNKRFQVLTASDHHGVLFYRRSYYWNNPEKFTIKQARDGYRFEHNSTPQFFKLANYQLEKLRRAKPGQIIKMTNSNRATNNWYVILIDENEEAVIEEAKKRLESVNQEIKEKVGDLMEEQKELREMIKKYKEVRKLP